ncbi:Small-conductance mechanosensitive channel [Halorhabdus sp. SVX81]|uniref:mechanosensitive ion channel domain-containing protein n=1 Tax=Halorhabdus sp. SVX81 TaxID=2978283 RepID=UPI0023DB1069|nr:mechanosensitive ion channel domain-containing protein [Halorhabdus sp. SVX81]WEL18518.1 Small-conductance mechanosensitive channel [Halorhabdus sp. SVX81]
MATVLAVGVIETMIESFQADVVGAIPRALSGLVFLTVAYVGIKLVTTVVRSVLERVYPTDQRLIVDFLLLVVGTFLWFGAGLALLNVLGLGNVAASLGTAAGFIGLGVSYALSNMIADTVAGVYLFKDPDFNKGDTVTTASTTGTVTDIGLRKSRLRTDDGLVVLANRNVESGWTCRSGPDEE